VTRGNATTSLRKTARGQRSERMMRDVDSGDDNCSDDSNNDSNGDTGSGDGDSRDDDSSNSGGGDSKAVEKTTIN
jgi:hypothetical protein